MIEVIRSKNNPRAKFAKRISEGEEPDLIFVEGLRMAREVAEISDVDAILVSEKFLYEHARGERWITSIERRFCFSDDVFKTIAQTHTPQGIALVVKRPADGKLKIAKAISQARVSLVLFLVEINNPSNLGAVYRTAEAAGVSGIIVSKKSTDAFSPKSLRGSMGASLRIPTWQNADFFEALEWSGGFGLISTALEAKAEASYSDIDWKTPRLLVVGSEAHGLTDNQLRSIAEPIKIPMKNGVESLNVGVSCGIALFERLKQIDSLI